MMFCGSKGRIGCYRLHQEGTHPSKPKQQDTDLLFCRALRYCSSEIRRSRKWQCAQRLRLCRRNKYRDATTVCSAAVAENGGKHAGCQLMSGVHHFRARHASLENSAGEILVASGLSTGGVQQCMRYSLSSMAIITPRSALI
jgi:hypothetical protein